MLTPSRVRADTHVHFHECYDEGRFLDAAARALGVAEPASHCVGAALCLTESFGANWFERLAERGNDAAIEGTRWRVFLTSEPNSVLVRSNDGKAVAIIAGRQIVCREGLEVLALGLREVIADRQPIREVMKQVSESPAIAVLPWGFGKWLGKRGEIVRDLVENPPCPFLLGDNGGRLAMLREPRLLRQARDRNLAVMPGTDPFPFSWDDSRVGTYGIEWEGTLSESSPFSDLKDLILDSTNSGRTFGRLERLLPFVRNQVAIQLRRFF